MIFETIGFDADDTLWRHETFYRLTQDRFVDLLSDHAGRDHLDERLLAAERRNLGRYGFGVKGFVLSMIETAIEVSDGRVPATVIAEIIAAGREMLDHPIELLPHAREAVLAMAADRRVILVTKGDLIDQERKLAQSGLGDLFQGVEIVSDKTPEVYSRVFARHGGPGGVGAGLMVGNSVKSDVLPMIAAGGWAVLVQHGLEWALDSAEAPVGDPRFRTVPDLGHLPSLLNDLEGSTTSSGGPGER